jgi:DNA-binding NtrC family response regulator
VSAASDARRDSPAASILIVEDDAGFRDTVAEMLQAADYRTRSVGSAEQAMDLLRTWIPDLVLTDHKLPQMTGTELIRAVRKQSPATEVVVMTAFSTLALAISAVKLGAFDFIEKPIDYESLLLVVERALEHQRLVLERERLQEQLLQRGAFPEVVGDSPAMQRVYERVRAVASTQTTVLIVGEHGTGKELIAKAIHSQSHCAQGPYVRVNCAAVPATLLESIMFGHERGAFTGAFARKIGLFERASGGTLLLDEVTEMAPELQAKLLRVLQTGEFERVGGRETLRSRARVIAATNVPPREAVASGKLRADLYYRLNVVTVSMPPLRDRREDIPALATGFLRTFARRHGRPDFLLSPATMRALLRYDWPGNVRELENAMERAVLLGGGREASLVDILDTGGGDAGADTVVRLPLPMTLRALEHLAALQTLELTRGNKSEAARLLGISRDTLYEKLRSPLQ